MKLSYRYQLIIAIAVITIIAVLVTALFIVPQFGVVDELSTQISDSDAGVSQAQALLEQRQSIKARSAETEAMRLRLANQIPETPELPALIVELQDTVNASGLEFASIAPNVPAQAEGVPYSTISIDVVVRGTWQDTVDLLRRLRTLTRQVRVESFSVTRFEEQTETETDEPALVETAIGLVVYTMPAEIVPVAPPVEPGAETTQ
ncbi:MAG: type 4a pilus biogenesis protein PilO [Clostridiales bacterium]|nr:type 4a pilus biogenesis protein PilO [Clostridiales bacterium]